MFCNFVPFTESVQWKIRIIPNTRPITWQSSTMIGSIVSFFRLQTDVILFFIETFYCSRVIDQRNHDLSVIGFLTTLHKNLVAIQNPAFIIESPRTFSTKHGSPVGTDSAGIGR